MTCWGWFLVDASGGEKANSVQRDPTEDTIRSYYVSHLGISLLVQISLAIGLAGLLWPDKFMPLFAVLMYPWPSSYRTVRANSIGALSLSVALFVALLAQRV